MRMKIKGLEARGIEVRIEKDKRGALETIEFIPTINMSESAHEHFRSFCEEMELPDSDREELIHFAIDLGMWRSLKDASK